MELQNSRVLPVAQDVVWVALNDPGVLQQCIPGCESLDRVDAHTFTVAMTASVGPVKARFTGKLTLSDVIPPKSYTLHFDGQGGAAGFGKGQAAVTLHKQGVSETVLAYEANAQVGGKLAQVGSRLIDGAARKLADDFFTRFAAIVAPGALAAGEGVPSDRDATTGRGAEAGSVASTGLPLPRKWQHRWWVWALMAILAIAAIVIGNHVR
ncbi:carbon monoxide dehydrogenase [Pandoraea terrae]|uniref:Carbon monoxide dehydrogenase n=1 Tax=Pandoraea terrae TaxID=1537710 RepID=A0A5E4USX6_9BURK|nr:carbon monoxide dehydrogenase subunit G [Pandoraea terrae]VVE02015.1 carbon monoxide dehydrogenase [Pandoraea terrae]